jgi:hypothetical protein
MPIFIRHSLKKKFLYSMRLPWRFTYYFAPAALLIFRPYLAGAIQIQIIERDNVTLTKAKIVEGFSLKTFLPRPNPHRLLNGDPMSGFILPNRAPPAW